MTEPSTIETLTARLAQALADVEALREAEERYRTLFDTIDEGYAEFDVILDDDGQVVDWRYLSLNAAFTRLTGMNAADVTGRLISEIVPDLEPEWRALYTRIIRTGEPARFEQEAASLGQWYEVFASRAGGPDSRRILFVYNDITERKRAEEALRESEERQAFLLKLSDALRPLTDPIEITGAATRVLGEYMQADRTFIAMMEPDGVNLDVHHEYLRPGVSSVIGHHDFDQFGTFVSPSLVEGNVIAVEDVATLPLTSTERAHYAAVGIAAYLLVPLVRDGRFAACFTCNHQTPRPWRAADQNIVRQTADRTWAALVRARAEAELRESEARFQQFANASSDVLWIRDVKSLAATYVSAASAEVYGAPPERLLGDEPYWLSLIVPEDRAASVDQLESVRRGEISVTELRVLRPRDRVFRFIRRTAFPLLDEQGRVEAAAGISSDVTETRLLTDHQGVLLAELQHRVRNIMAITRSITARSADRAETVPQYAELLSGRLLALARVQALLTRGANVQVDLGDLVRDEVNVQAQHEGQYDLIGPKVALSPKAAEVLTLAVHELSTNALKYGGLSVPHGKVTVRWNVFEKRGAPWLSFDWEEAGAPQRPEIGEGVSRRRGFGSELIEGRIPYELKGTGRLAIGPGGAQCHLEFPLREGASVLETGAPQRATVFGGVLDMTGEADLSGQTVLVVEDEYYLASDLVRALQGAGAEVMGPSSSEDDARSELEGRTPDAVVLDINLGSGATFKLAEALKDRGIPFVFVTGYDQGVIPTEFEQIRRLEKPVQLRQIVSAVSELFARAV